MDQLAGLIETYATLDTLIYTDGSDIDLPNHELIEKQIIPGTGFFDRKFFLHGRTPEGKYVKGTLWEEHLVNKMESDMQWFRDHGANIPKFEKVLVKTIAGKSYYLIISDYIEDLNPFEIFKKYNQESIGEAVLGVIRFAHIHLDYLELSIEQGLPILSDVHLRQLHVDKFGKVYMLDLEPRYGNSSTQVLLNESSNYKAFVEKYRDQVEGDSLEIEAFVRRCEEISKRSN